MKKLIVIFCLIGLLLLTLVLTTCTKEYSYEGGPPAVFYLLGTPDECTEFKVNGSYYIGIGTDSGNTVEVNAEVSTTGNYSITTGAADGISFSSAGTFTDTGFQTIVLHCTGTPDSAGVFTFTIPGGTGCHFSVAVINQPPADYVLSGSPNDCTTPKYNGTFMALKALSASNIVIINVTVISTGDYSITTDTVDGISFSASGRFTTTGDQQVTLTGSGTPNSPGLFYFHLNTPSSQCTFSLQVISPDPLATYVLQSGTAGSQFLCTPQSIQGNYIAGTPLNISNTITITAYATIPGNYTISTGTVNGIMFQNSGTFASIGLQSVILNGYGTPLTSGTFAFVPQIIGPAPLGGESCDVNLVVQ